jgi:hypothetical protein
LTIRAAGVRHGLADVITLASARGSGASSLSVGNSTPTNQNTGIINVDPASGGSRTITAGQLYNDGTLNVNTPTTVTSNSTPASRRS